MGYFSIQNQFFQNISIISIMTSIRTEIAFQKSLKNQNKESLKKKKYAGKAVKESTPLNLTENNNHQTIVDLEDLGDPQPQGTLGIQGTYSTLRGYWGPSTSGYTPIGDWEFDKEAYNLRLQRHENCHFIVKAVFFGVFMIFMIVIIMLEMNGVPVFPKHT